MRRAMRAFKLTAPNMVLGLLCAMYLILYIDRVNIATAAKFIQDDLGLNNTELGLAFSAGLYSIASSLSRNTWLLRLPRWRMRSPDPDG